jgi:hypothetical protein
MGKDFSVTVEYAGDKVLEQAGEGSYYVRARTSWYPNLNGFGERALYDLTYQVPKKYKVVSVGKLESEGIEDDRAVSHWVTPMPSAIRPDVPCCAQQSTGISGATIRIHKRYRVLRMGETSLVYQGT